MASRQRWSNKRSLNLKYDRALNKTRARPLNSILPSAQGNVSYNAATRHRQREALFNHLGLSDVDARPSHSVAPSAGFGGGVRNLANLRSTGGASTRNVPEADSPPQWLYNVMCPEAAAERVEPQPQQITYYTPAQPAHREAVEEPEWYSEQPHPSRNNTHAGYVQSAPRQVWPSSVPPTAQPAVPLWWTPHGVFTSDGQLVASSLAPALPQPYCHPSQYSGPRHQLGTTSYHTSYLASENRSDLMAPFAHRAHRSNPDVQSYDTTPQIDGSPHERPSFIPRPTRPPTHSQVRRQIERPPVPTRDDRIIRNPAPQARFSEITNTIPEEYTDTVDNPHCRSPSPTFTVEGPIKRARSESIESDNSDELEVEDSLNGFLDEGYLAVDSKGLQDDHHNDHHNDHHHDHDYNHTALPVLETTVLQFPLEPERPTSTENPQAKPKLKRTDNHRRKIQSPTLPSMSEHAYEPSDGEDPLLLRPAKSIKTQGPTPAKAPQQSYPTPAKTNSSPVKRSPARMQRATERAWAALAALQSEGSDPAKSDPVPAATPVPPSPALVPVTVEGEEDGDVESIGAFSEGEGEKVEEVERVEKRVRFDSEGEIGFTIWRDGY